MKMKMKMKIKTTTAGALNFIVYGVGVHVFKKLYLRWDFHEYSVSMITRVTVTILTARGFCKYYRYPYSGRIVVYTMRASWAVLHDLTG